MKIRFALVSVVLACGELSCASTEKAVEVTRHVESSSAEALTVLQSVQDLSRGYAKALQSLYGSASTHEASLRKDIARERMSAVVSEAKRDLESARSSFLTRDLPALERRALDSLDAQLKEAFKEAHGHADVLRTAAEEAEEKAKEFPDELPLRAAADKALLRYFAFVAKVNETEADARDKVQAAIRTQNQAAEKRLQEFVDVQNGKIDAAFKQQTDAVDSTAAAAPLEVPDPMTASIDALRKYVEAVVQAQKALRTYIEVSNPSVGNALLKQFLSSTVSSFKGGVAEKDASKLPTFAEATDAWKSVGAEALGSLKTQLAELKAGFADQLRSLASQSQTELDAAIRSQLAAIPGPSTPK